MPVWKWILLLLLSLVLSTIMMGMAEAAGEAVSPEWVQWIVYVAVSAAMIALYGLFVRWFEREHARDIPMRRLAGETAKGLAVGAGFFILVIAAMFIFGIYRVAAAGTDKPLSIVTAFFMFLCVGVGEEIVFRGVLFRWIDGKWGFPVALAVSAVLFGAMHIWQPGATWWSSLAIAVEAGLLLGAAYKYSGTLWMPIGIHWAWNFVQGNVFGFQVSGGEAGISLFEPRISGPEILTGGAFGAEASLITVILGLAMSVWFILRVKRMSR